MGFNSGFQLSLELTKVFGSTVKAVSAGKALIDFARDLRKSGSDIVVEEDLADIFGRGRIEHNLEAEFKKQILGGTRIIPLYPDCDIHLTSGPGPTVTRTFRDKDRRYLSTVIQLSMLAWMHDRTSLASSLVQCMAKRFQQNIPGASASPRFEDIFGTLEACSSQTSSFIWDDHVQQVRNSILQHFPHVLQHHRFNMDSTIPELLPTSILLAAMDYLYLVQSLPEDRKMVLQTQEGIIPIIIWAHHILGLTVSVHRFTGEAFQFGVGPSQVIIHLVLDMATRTRENLNILLLDREMKVVLESTSIPPLRVEFTRNRIAAQERHSLRNYGSECLRRKFNSLITTPNDDPIFQEAAQLILAFAIFKSKTLSRAANSEGMIRLAKRGGRHRDSLPCFYDLELWRIHSAARVIFHDIHYDQSEVDTYVQLIKTHKLADIPLPATMQLYLHRLTAALGRDTFMMDEMIEFVEHLTTLVLVFAHVAEVEDCSDIPLVFQMDFYRSSSFLQMHAGESIMLEEKTLLSFIVHILVTVSPVDTREDLVTFLYSDFGWTVFLGCVDDRNPAHVRPEILHIKKGIPTNIQTGEQKYRIVDGLSNDVGNSGITILDREGTYVPRCVNSVKLRTEFFSSQAQRFLLSIRFELDCYDVSVAENVHFFRGYRDFHRSLWMMHLTKRCQHSGAAVEEAKLGSGVATAKGHDWVSEGIEGRKLIPERICISLVKGDQRARWLAISCAANIAPLRSTMLRSDDCCENCALDAVTILPGQWILII